MVDSSLYPSYRELYKYDPVFARKKVTEVYPTLMKKSLTAQICKTKRQILRRHKSEGEQGLQNRSRRPKHSPHRTPLHIEGVILTERKKSGYGRDRIARNPSERGVLVTPSTVRYVLKHYGASAKYKRSPYRKRQRFYDFEHLHPLEHFQVDLKEIYDQSSLPPEAVAHGRCHHVPPDQWTAIDGKTTLRFLSYSYEKSFSNGSAFMPW